MDPILKLISDLKYRPEDLKHHPEDLKLCYRISVLCYEATSLGAVVLEIVMVTVGLLAWEEIHFTVVMPSDCPALAREMNKIRFGLRTTLPV